MHGHIHIFQTRYLQFIVHDHTHGLLTCRSASVRSSSRRRAISEDDFQETCPLNCDRIQRVLERGHDLSIISPLGISCHGIVRMKK